MRVKEDLEVTCLACKALLSNLIDLYKRVIVGAFAFTSFRSRDLMSRDSASANRVAEEVYPTPWCWISFLLINHLPTNANSIPRIRDSAMRSRRTDNYNKLLSSILKLNFSVLFVY